MGLETNPLHPVPLTWEPQRPPMLSGVPFQRDVLFHLGGLVDANTSPFFSSVFPSPGFNHGSSVVDCRFSGVRLSWRTNFLPAPTPVHPLTPATAGTWQLGFRPFKKLRFLPFFQTPHSLRPLVQPRYHFPNPPLGPGVRSAVPPC